MPAQHLDEIEQTLGARHATLLAPSTVSLWQ
jgi:hypothetical protein